MAFNSNKNKSAPAPANNDSWKAQGFINISLKTKDGGTRKLGAIALHENNVNENQLLEWLKADPANLEKMIDRMTFEFRTSEVVEDKMFDLS